MGIITTVSRLISFCRIIQTRQLILRRHPPVRIPAADEKNKKYTCEARLVVGGYCARLKAIGVNLFRAAIVKRAIDALKTAPGTLTAVVWSTILAVKEYILSPWHLLRDILHTAIENMAHVFRIAA